MMSVFIAEQLKLGGCCILYGMAITLVYDLLRIARRVITHSSFFVSIEDFLYWIAVAIGIFLLLYYTNDGNLRWVAILVVFFGMLLYKKIFGNNLVIFMSTKINQILHLVVRVIAIPLKLVKRAFMRVFKRTKLLAGAIKSGLTGNIKKGIMVLCKRQNNLDKSEKKGKKDESQKVPQG